MKPLVSIIMPVYNAERFLRDSLFCLSKQTYRNLEIICVNDGSTDGSEAIIRDFAAKDSRFRLISQNNSGAAVARNNGLDHAAGKYGIVLDADDLFRKNMVASAVRAIERDGADVAVFGYYWFHHSPGDRRWPGYDFPAERTVSPQAVRHRLFQFVYGVPWNKIYSLDLIRKTGIRFQNLRNANDLFFSDALMMEAERITFLRKRLVFYRIGHAESTTEKKNEYPTEFGKALLAIYGEMEKKNRSDLYTESFRKLVLTHVMTAFLTSKSPETFYAVYRYTADELFPGTGITRDDILRYSAEESRFLADILEGRPEKEALYDFTAYLQQTMIPKKSIAYRIGKKLIGILECRPVLNLIDLLNR